MRRIVSTVAATLLCYACFAQFTRAQLEVGTGIYDITGPAADINFMGYAIPSQVGNGIHLRLRARAFVVSSNQTTPGGKYGKFAFVSADIGMGSHVVLMRVLELLDEEPSTKGVFNAENLCISGTHTHSSPAGFLTHTIFQVTSLGFVKQTYEAYSNGIAQAVIRANKNVKPSRAFLNVGKLLNSNINRSPSAYLENPAEERAEYADGNTDKDMTLLKFVEDSEEMTPIGMINWFSVHGTSMNNTNGLISGDNKGLASYLFERRRNPNGTLPGKGNFVAAFAATNLGDVSPNTKGAFCADTGEPCEMVHSTCNGKNEMCRGVGPGKDGDMFESTRIIAENQDERAEELWNSEGEELTGPVDVRHTWIRMTNLTFNSTKGKTLTTCGSAFGYAFAAGTTDGPGAFNFVQSTTSTNPFWNAVSHVLSKPTEEEVKCHAPKPILLNLEGITEPYPWSAEVLPLQVVRLGRFFVLSVPSELTTMAGRRLRKFAKQYIVEGGLAEDPVVVIAGLSNEYADYTTTFEEYQAQRYEGASTAYGPNELEAFISQFRRILGDMAAGRPSATLPIPPTYLDKQIELRPGVIFDSVGIGHHYGDVTQQPPASVKRGNTVSATFRSANPRNNLRIEDTFLTVERSNDDGSWTIVATDGDWSTKFMWSRPSKVSSESYAKITWDIPEDMLPGTYRIRHFNAHKSVLGKISEFSGTTNSFSVV
eukprot:g466.t1